MSGCDYSGRCSYCFEEHPRKCRMNNTQMDPNGDRYIFDMANEHIETLVPADKAKTAFTDFCRSTSLHGWQHLSGANPHSITRGGGKYMWVLIVVASIGVASFFLFTSVDDFTSKYVVTNIDTTTAPLNVSSHYLFNISLFIISQFEKIRKSPQLEIV